MSTQEIKDIIKAVGEKNLYGSKLDCIGVIESLRKRHFIKAIFIQKHNTHYYFKISNGKRLLMTNVLGQINVSSISKGESDKAFSQPSALQQMVNRKKKRL